MYVRGLPGRTGLIAYLSNAEGFYQAEYTAFEPVPSDLALVKIVLGQRQISGLRNFQIARRSLHDGNLNTEALHQ